MFPEKIWTLRYFINVVFQIGILLVTYSVAKLSWIYFEGPLQRRGHAFRY